MLFRWRNYNRRKAGDEVLPTQEKNNDNNAAEIRCYNKVCDWRESSLYGPSSDYRGHFSRRGVRYLDRVTMNWMWLNSGDHQSTL